MKILDILNIEETLNIKLPLAYKEILLSPPIFKSNILYEYALYVDPLAIIEENSGYLMNFGDISDLEDGTRWGSIMRFIRHGSKRKILRNRQAWYEEWVSPQRFIVGGDGGEEVYFIHLSDSNCSVYSFDLELQKSRLAYATLDMYVDELSKISIDD